MSERSIVPAPRTNFRDGSSARMQSECAICSYIGSFNAAGDLLVFHVFLENKI